jgi:hypothetical protein
MTHKILDKKALQAKGASIEAPFAGNCGTAAELSPLSSGCMA